MGVQKFYLRSLRSRILFCTPHLKIRGAAHAHTPPSSARRFSRLRRSTSASRLPVSFFRYFRPCTNLALFRDIDSIRGAHTIAGGSNESRGAEPPHFNHCGQSCRRCVRTFDRSDRKSLQVIEKSTIDYPSETKNFIVFFSRFAFVQVVKVIAAWKVIPRRAPSATTE